MMDNINTKILLGHAAQVCPYCKKGIDPKCVSYHDTYISESDSIKYYAICKCSFLDCTMIFFVEYETEVYAADIDDNGDFIHKQSLIYSKTYPSPIPELEFDERITEISPDFVETYNHALISEANNLDTITGLSFRKAFEILVKDYAIHLNKDNDLFENSSVLEKSLNNVITKYFKDSEFQPIFQKITWLGNDHSHTFNKHEEYNVSDLKRFINACVSKIVSILDLEELETIESHPKS